MKKLIFIIAIIIVLIFLAATAYAAAEKRIKLTGTVLEVSTLPQNAVKKFTDGGVTCYSIQANNGVALSCVK